MAELVETKCGRCSKLYFIILGEGNSPYCPECSTRISGSMDKYGFPMMKAISPKLITMDEEGPPEEYNA